MSASTRAKATPRRKAGSKASKAKRSIAFRLVVEGQDMLVRYFPESTLGNAKFEFRSPRKPPRRIVLSETGYLRHFVDRGRVALFESPQEYARDLVFQTLDGGKRSAPLENDEAQLFLF